MKRLFALLIILITIVGGVSADDAYNFPFTLLLRRNGTDSVWFTKNASDTVTNKISLHIFPIISASSTETSSVTSIVYLHWLKQSSNDVRIKITFVGNESTDHDSTFMLWCASIESQGATKTAEESENNGINFDVVIKDKGGEGSEVGHLSFGTNENPSPRLEPATDDARSITFNPAKTTTGGDFVYTSPLAITMTINPASKDTDGTAIPQWGVDIQFVGYIKATIIAAT